MTAEAPLPVLHGSAAESFAYYGEREGWFIALSQHRDSDALDRSNWTAITDDMFTRFGDDVAIERMNHWAVGWVEYLLVKPSTPAVDAALTWKAKLADYPVADEDAYSLLEDSETWCVRCDRGMRSEHPLNGCTFRSDEDASEIEWRWKTRKEDRNAR